MRCKECDKELIVYEDRNNYKVVDVKNGNAIVICSECNEDDKDG